TRWCRWLRRGRFEAAPFAGRDRTLIAPRGTACRQNATPFVSSALFLWEMRRYFRRVWARLLIGSLAGIAMNTAVVLPAILLGRAIDAALALERGQASADAVTGAALLF